MDIEAICNFRRISDRLTTSGIVNPDGFKALRAQGCEVVINLLPDTSDYAIANERDAVESQGMEYIYIPVDFKQPTSADFLRFSEALDQVQEKNVHVHCAANYRVSAFYSLYLVSRGLWGEDQAMDFIHSLWQPTEHSGWSDFIGHILEEVRAQ
ncbi:MAG: hypothetical protein VR73_12935 [Gammaproteobacteria bacterium BRH_c0]|nr:MAG: hypothetical protein VR73_12935 [Gammaproteobacteria bacterium BRH_c0]